MSFNTDNSGLIVNGENTFHQVTMDLIERQHVVLNWGDQAGSVHNVLLSFDPTRVGTTSGIVDGGPGKLWVGVAGMGCYGFTTSAGFLSPDYVHEKLGVTGWTATALAVLLTEVRTRIVRELYSLANKGE